MTDEEIAVQLLQYLRETNQTDSLAYLEGPTRIGGGFESSIFGLRLSCAPDSFSGPLVLRLFDDFHPPERARLEATAHNTLVKLGYPAPRVFVTGTDKRVLGGAFLVMERIIGHTLAADFEGLGQGRSVGELVRFLMRVPRIFRKMSRTMAAAQFSLHELPAEPLMRAMEAEGLSVNAITFGGRLESLTHQTQHAGLSGLRAGAIWLVEHRPAETTPPAICHCDFQPFNILAQDGRVTGVLLSPAYYSDSAAWCQKDRMRGGRRRMRRRARQAWWLS
jgi:aminoglycoside phosphotransferase (APT) family kinase protein